MADPYELFLDSLGPELRTLPGINRDFFNRFTTCQMDILQKAGLPARQTAAIEAELIRCPGVGTLEIVAHCVARIPPYLDMELQLTPQLRTELAEDADCHGEGFYQKEELMLLPDQELGRAYLDAAVMYVQSQGLW